MEAKGIKTAWLLYENNILLSSKFVWIVMLPPVRLRPFLQKGCKIGKKERSHNLILLGNLEISPAYREKYEKCRGKRILSKRSRRMSPPMTKI